LKVRTPGGASETRDEAGPPRVVRVDPGDGASGVLRDTPVLARLSHPCDPDSLVPDSFGVHDDGGIVPGRLELSPDGHLVIWLPLRALCAGGEHRVVSRGLRCRQGSVVAPHESCFRAGPFRSEDLAP